MRISFGCDKAGRTLADELIRHAENLGHRHVDCGASGDEPSDYPVYAERVAGKVLSEECDFGVVICGTGIGMSMAANKLRGIRCALCSDCYSAKMARAHNNANLIALGARTIGTELAKMILDSFLTTSYTGERHQRRVEMIAKLEAGETLASDGSGSA